VRARKKRASKRRGEISGVTQRSQGTSAAASIRLSSVVNCAPSATALRASFIFQPAASWPSSRPASSNVSRTAATNRPAAVGGRQGLAEPLLQRRGPGGEQRAG
jgi:hypothetical protein